MSMTDQEKRKYLVAQLQSQGLSQKDIADFLSLSQSMVSTIIQAAPELVETKRTVRWPSRVSKDDQLSIEAAAFPERKALIRKLGDIARSRAAVAPNKIDCVHVDEHAGGTEFGRRAAGIVASLIVKSKCVSVAWGRTIWGVVDEIGRANHAAKPDLVFIPIAGEPLNSHDRGFSPSVHAEILSESYRCAKISRLSLQGVPARIPSQMNKEASVIRRYVNYCRDYQKIFGNPNEKRPGLIDNVDMILSGIGDAHTSQNDPWYEEFKEMERDANLGKFFQGNIGGVWLPTDKATKEEVERVDQVNKRWLGVQKHNIQKCADRAAENPEKSGVVVLAREKNKADILIRTVGLVNHYIISRDLVKELLIKL
jgi:hypothetical protein